MLRNWCRGGRIRSTLSDVLADSAARRRQPVRRASDAIEGDLAAAQKLKDESTAR